MDSSLSTEQEVPQPDRRDRVPDPERVDLREDKAHRHLFLGVGEADCTLGVVVKVSMDGRFEGLDPVVIEKRSDQRAVRPVRYPLTDLCAGHQRWYGKRRSGKQVGHCLYPWAMSQGPAVPLKIAQSTEQ